MNTEMEKRKVVAVAVITFQRSGGSMEGGRT